MKIKEELVAFLLCLFGHLHVPHPRNTAKEAVSDQHGWVPGHPCGPSYSEHGAGSLPEARKSNTAQTLWVEEREQCYQSKVRESSFRTSDLSMLLLRLCTSCFTTEVGDMCGQRLVASGWQICNLDQDIRSGGPLL